MFGLLSRRTVVLLECHGSCYLRSYSYFLQSSVLCPRWTISAAHKHYDVQRNSYIIPAQVYYASSVLSTPSRFITSATKPSIEPSPPDNNAAKDEGKSLSLVQRFKNAYKVYGKVLIVVHGIGSVAWLGLFYGVAYSGLNVQELLVTLHAPEWMLKPFHAAGGSVGVFASAYVLYKVLAPLRYALTLYLTPLVVHKLRTSGRLPPLAEEDRLRNLALEGMARTRSRLRQRRRRNRKPTARK